MIFSSSIRDIIFVAARFDIEYPLYSSFLYSVGKDVHNPMLSKKIMEASMTFIKSLLEKAYLNGQIRENVNLDFTAFIISYLSVDIGEYLSAKYNYSYQKVLRSKSGNLPITDNQLEEVLFDLIDFFKQGIAAK